jgi:hypothetical protein
MFLVDPKVFRFVVKGVKAICLGVTIEFYGKLEISYINVDNRIIIIIRNGTKTISLQTLFGRPKNYKN